MPAEGPIAVVGAGVMGAEIALVAAQSGGAGWSAGPLGAAEEG